MPSLLDHLPSGFAGALHVIGPTSTFHYFGAAGPHLLILSGFYPNWQLELQEYELLLSVALHRIACISIAYHQFQVIGCKNCHLTRHGIPIAQCHECFAFFPSSKIGRLGLGHVYLGLGRAGGAGAILVKNLN